MLPSRTRRDAHPRLRGLLVKAFNPAPGRGHLPHQQIVDEALIALPPGRDT